MVRAPPSYDRICICSVLPLYQRDPRDSVAWGIRIVFVIRDAIGTFSNPACSHEPVLRRVAPVGSYYEHIIRYRSPENI